MKTLKKLIAILTLVLVAFTAFAPVKSYAAEEKITLTIAAPEGVSAEVLKNKEIAIYKLFNLTTGTDGEGKTTYDYTWDGLTATQNFFADATNFADGKTYLTVLEATTYVRGLSGTDLTNFAEQFYTYCKNNGYNPLATKLSGEDKVFEGLEKGYYLVYDVQADDDQSAKSVAILSNLIASESIYLKIETVTVDKAVSETTANVGDDVKFTITSAVPDTTGFNTYTFTVNDTMSKGLTYNNDLVVKINLDDDAELETYLPKLNEGTAEEVEQYKLTTTTDKDTGITTITVEFISSEFLKLPKDAPISIEYTAKLNDDAVITNEVTNEVDITYSNDPTTDSTSTTVPDKVYVYTYDLEFTKKNSLGEALNGAKFALRLPDGTYAKFDENGIFDGSSKITDKAQLTESEIITSSGTTIIDGEEVALGLFKISGLEAGTYTLVEIEAPEGYNLPTFEFDFKIEQKLNSEGALGTAADGSVGTATFTYMPENNAANGYMSVTNSADEITSTRTFDVTVLNAKEGELPTTGGIGTTIFTVAGISVMLIAGVALVIRNRKND